MGRKIKATVDMSNGLPTTHKAYVNYKLNPPTLNRDADGNYITSQLERIKRTYEAQRSFLYGLKGQIVVIKKKIESREESSRSRYNILMNKEQRTLAEIEELYGRTLEIEALYNQIPPLENQIRTLTREIKMTYPESFLKVLYKGLGEEFVKENY
ncbi:hypothetical protein J27TS8_25080 [Robertmurraya siralis]|uniref:Uncharacterized protein n=1 Tax=Robertmurraya siralis TaxID=77777 RepID=A0A919WIE0_9BACI|nr:hypothetical protein [Robertmurraya siralis]GIN62515.1 hypothetical protein J27TS8_25080 [Robertmurraya siralis]